MANKNTGIDRIRSHLGELSLELTDYLVIRTWLKTVIERSVRSPSLSSFAPFQHYFLSDQPIEVQLADLFSAEFPLRTEDGNEPLLTVLTLSLASHLSTPEAFCFQVGEGLVLSDLYRNMFRWLAETDPNLALDVAIKAVRTPAVAELTFESSELLAFFLMREINIRRISKADGKFLFSTIFTLLLETPSASAADIPEVLDSNIRALGSDNEALYELFCASSKLEEEYRRYLAAHFPRRLVKYMDEFSNQIKMALPREFLIFVRGLSEARFAKLRASYLIASLGIERPRQVRSIREAKVARTQGSGSARTHQPRQPLDLNEAAALAHRRASEFA